MALAEIGCYTGVDRLATWENHLDGVTYGSTYEWCNDGIEPAIDYLRSMTIEAGKPWFDMFEDNNIICTSDIYSLDPFIAQMLEVQGVNKELYFVCNGNVIFRKKSLSLNLNTHSTNNYEI